MEEQLRKLVENAEPKPKSLICVSGNSSKLKTSFIPPLDFPPSHRYEMALIRLETYYSFPNITTSNNHVKISFDEGKTWLDVYIPVGCYEIKAINTELQRFIMQKTGDKKAEKRIVLSPNPNTLRCVLEVLDVKCQVDFDSLCTVLGFDRKVYKVGRHESEHIVNILSVNSILVHCDVIESSRLNGIEASIIYGFFPDGSPGDKIISIPRHLIYIPLTLNIISRMTCWVTDQNGEELDLQGEELTLTFHIKAC
jgi:hypothetical protein